MQKKIQRSIQKAIKRKSKNIKYKNFENFEMNKMHYGDERSEITEKT